MAIKYSTTLRNNQLTVQFPTGPGGNLKIYTGSPPVNPDASATGTLLLTISLPPTPFGSPSSGSISKEGTWSGVASNSGTAGWFRLNLEPGMIAQGTVGTSGADMIIDNASITSGQTITVTSFTITNGNA